MQSFGELCCFQFWHCIARNSRYKGQIYLQAPNNRCGMELLPHFAKKYLWNIWNIQSNLVIRNFLVIAPMPICSLFIRWTVLLVMGNGSLVPSCFLFGHSKVWLYYHFETFWHNLKHFETAWNSLKQFETPWNSLKQFKTGISKYRQFLKYWNPLKHHSWYKIYRYLWSRYGR